jgi:hypothetical protein
VFLPGSSGEEAKAFNVSLISPEKTGKTIYAFHFELLHMKRRVFHWLLAAALAAASLPLTAQSGAGRGMGPSPQVFF